MPSRQGRVLAHNDNMAHTNKQQLEQHETSEEENSEQVYPTNMEHELFLKASNNMVWASVISGWHVPWYPWGLAVYCRHLDMHLWVGSSTL